jgi:hypothetical protein
MRTWLLASALASTLLGVGAFLRVPSSVRRMQGSATSGGGAHVCLIVETLVLCMCAWVEHEHACMHAPCMQTRVIACARAFVRAYVRSCVRAFVRACLPACLRACVPACLPACAVLYAFTFAMPRRV